MKAARSWLALLLLAASTSRAGEVPILLLGDGSGLPGAGRGGPVRRPPGVAPRPVRRRPLLAVPQWAARRYSGNGLFGSTARRREPELCLNSGIALNFFLTERIQMRYDRREYREGRFDVSDERFDVVWHAGAGWARRPLRVAGVRQGELLARPGLPDRGPPEAATPSSCASWTSTSSGTTRRTATSVSRAARSGSSPTDSGKRGDGASTAPSTSASSTPPRRPGPARPPRRGRPEASSDSRTSRPSTPPPAGPPGCA